MNYKDQLEKHALEKSLYDQEHQEERLKRLDEFASKDGWVGDYAKRKLRELASGMDDKTDLPDISGIISHG